MNQQQTPLTEEQKGQIFGILAVGCDRETAANYVDLTTADIQTTMPSAAPERLRSEVRPLVKHRSTPDGGLIVFNYGFDEAIGTTAEATGLMFRQFAAMMDY